MSRFQTTRWSLIHDASDDPARARAALEQLCRAYRPPVLAYIRRHGHAPADADDLAQAFFLRFVEHAWYAQADPCRGRFRALLLTALRHFLADRDAYETALRRNSAATVHDVLPCLADDGPNPEEAFTEAWLATVVERASARLEQEFERTGKHLRFAQLAPLLVEHADSHELQALAQASGVRTNTLAVQVHRMRQRLRQLVRLELMQTVGDRASLELELAELRGALESARP